MRRASSGLWAERRELKGARRARGAGAALLAAVALAILCVASLALGAFVPLLGAGPSVRPRVHGTPRQAEGDAAAVEARAVVAEAEEAAAPVPPPAEPSSPPEPLFKELVVSNRTDERALMKAMVATFKKEGARALDLVLIDPRCKHKLVYAIGMLPDSMHTAAQVLMRRRDRRLRVRVLQDYQPVLGDDAEELFVARQSNLTLLGNLMKSKFVDVLGNNRKRTVNLKFAGKETASMAIMAIENAARSAYRELTFVPRFQQEMVPVKAPAKQEGQEAGAETHPEPEMRKQVNIVVSVTAT